jgi:SulP family sulfate permease
MDGTSSFSPIEGGRPAGWRAFGRSLVGAAEGAAAAVPLCLGCATLLYAPFGPAVVSAGVFATLLAMAWIHLSTATSRRPFLYSARIFETTTLVAMLDQVVVRLPGWGLEDTAGVRIAFLCIISAVAGLLVALLYLVRAERLTPFIPSPVFAGFSNSIAVALLVSQSRSLWTQAAGALASAEVLTIAVASLATTLAIRRWLPGRPAAAGGLGAGLLVGLAWAAAGHRPAVVSDRVMPPSLPVFKADFAALVDPGVQVWPVLLLVVGNAAILAAMIFINNAMATQALTQIDGRRSARRRDGVASGAGLLAGGLAGSAPMSGSIVVCLAVARATPVRAGVMALVAVVSLAVYFSGVLSWVPLAAVAGVLLAEGWLLADRPSLRLAADWARRRKLPANAREDLALIVAVTALAVLANMVVAAIAGLILGLFLFALRSARNPVRHLWTGKQLSSNCARASAELRILAEHGGGIRVFELEGDLFFAVGASLDQALQSGSEGATCCVIEWSRVRHLDTSVAITIANFEARARERGLLVAHAAASHEQGDVAGMLRRRQPGALIASDLDFALELAENHLIQRHAAGQALEASTVLEATRLFDGFDAAERAQLEGAMTQRLYRPGEVLLAAGSESDELMLVLQGSASVLVPGAQGHRVRIAGVRRGAILGEVGFLDGSPRSAEVVAQDDVVVATLTREQYDRLCRTTHTVVPKLLANIALALATRLRHANRLALARSRPQSVTAAAVPAG